MKHPILRLFFSGLVLLFGSASAWADCPVDRQIPNQFLLRLRPAQSEALSASSFNKAHKTSRLRAALKADAVRILHDREEARGKVFSASAQSAVPPTLAKVNSRAPASELAQAPEVLSVEPDCLVDLARTPNDPEYDEQDYHTTISSPTGWDSEIGSVDIIIGISDTGVAFTHEDLSSNMYRNLTEFNGSTGVDDDGNGYIDDIFGSDFASDDGNPQPGTGSDAAHGTHVAGIAAAVGNNSVGVTGVAWNARIMALKGFPDSGGSTSMSSLLESIYYGTTNGANIINASWGATGAASSSEIEAFQYAIDNGVTVVVAAGNSTADASGFTPAGITINELITVGASTTTDTLATFSNFGSVVDIVAPGGNAIISGMGFNEFIYATMPASEGLYGNFRGTSMASPVVAGLAALILSVNPNFTPEQVRNIIRNSADLITVTAANSARSAFTYPRINVANAIALAQNPNAGTSDSLCVVQDLCAVGGDSSSGSSSSAAAADDNGGCGLSMTTAASSSGTMVFWALLLLPLGLVRRLRRRR